MNNATKKKKKKRNTLDMMNDDGSSVSRSVTTTLQRFSSVVASAFPSNPLIPSGSPPFPSQSPHRFVLFVFSSQFAEIPGTLCCLFLHLPESANRFFSFLSFLFFGLLFLCLCSGVFRIRTLSLSLNLGCFSNFLLLVLFSFFPLFFSFACGNGELEKAGWGRFGSWE